jgi:hypothetical protein
MMITFAVAWFILELLETYNIVGGGLPLSLFAITGFFDCFMVLGIISIWRR